MGVLSVNQTDVAVATKIKTPKVPKYAVVMYNDDVTTFDFVIGVLMEIFDKDQPTAAALADLIHHTGSAEVGRYSREVAEVKVEETVSKARQNGYPLMCKVEGIGDD